MGSNYVLTTDHLAWRHSHPSTADAFEAASNAVDRLMASLAVEEAFAVLIANYIAFEKAVASVNVENMVRSGASMAELLDRRREVDRHLVNLLAAGEMASEHALRRTKKEFGRKSNEVARLDGAFREQRESLVGFWATECLRNAVLHNALPITSWTTGGKWVGLETADGNLSKRSPTARLEHSVTFAFATDLLMLDSKLDRALIDRLKAERADEKGNVSWVLTIREYVEGLSLIIGEVRKIWAEVESAASALLLDMVHMYRASLPEDEEQPLYLFVAETSDDGRWQRDVLVSAGLEAQLAELRGKNKPMVNLHRRLLIG
ncbi:hypothetical protein [Phenylobacterium sp.]|uniref:hypothetical protein n=1 Tax=Phenylobacterium sp. TaxID=1871053 RepID=UPI002FD953BF